MPRSSSSGRTEKSAIPTRRENSFIAARWLQWDIGTTRNEQPSGLDLPRAGQKACACPKWRRGRVTASGVTPMGSFTSSAVSMR